MKASGPSILDLFRRVTPGAIVPATVSGRIWLEGRLSRRMAMARQQMRFVVGDSASQLEVERLAAAYLKCMAWRGESRWHPELVTRQQVVGVEHLRSVLGEGNGCLVSFVHHGWFEGSFGSVARQGIGMHVVSLAEMFSDSAPGFLKAHTRTVTHVEGVELINVTGGSAAVRSSLAAGHAVAVAMDPPGHTPARIFGRDLMLSSGGTRIAMELNVPIILMSSRRIEKGRRVSAFVELSEPLRPRSFSSERLLHEELLRRHEKSILSWPEAADQPYTFMQDKRLVKQPTEYRSTT